MDSRIPARVAPQLRKHHNQPSTAAPSAPSPRETNRGSKTAWPDRQPTAKTRHQLQPIRLQGRRLGPVGPADPGGHPRLHLVLLPHRAGAGRDRRPDPTRPARICRRARSWPWSPGQKGIQLDVLPEGRYFRNPYHVGLGDRRRSPTSPPASWACRPACTATDLPPGQIIAERGHQGHPRRRAAARQVPHQPLRLPRGAVRRHHHPARLASAWSPRWSGEDVLNNDLPAEAAQHVPGGGRT